MLTLWVTYQGLLLDQLRLGPRALTKLDEAILIVLFGLTLSDAILRGRLNRSAFSPFLLAFVGVAVVSLLLNRSWPTYMAWGLLALFQYYVMYLFIKYHGLHPSVATRHLHFLVSLGLSTVPIAVYQYVRWGRFSDGMNPHWDRVVGPFFEGTANVFAYFCGFLILTLLAQFFMTRGQETSRLWGRAQLSMIVLLLTIPYFLASGKSAYYLLPLALVVMFYRELLSVRRGGRILLVGTIFVGLFWFVSVSLYNVDFAGEVSIPRRIEENSTASSFNLGRLLYFRVSQDLMNDQPWGNIVGVGPGMFSSYPAREFGSPLLQQSLGSSHTNLIPSNLISVRTEYGYLGFLLYVLLIFSTHWEIRRLANARGAPAWITTAHRGCLVYFLGGALAEMIWETQVTAFYFWLLSGLFYALASAGTRQSATRSPASARPA